MNTINLDGIPYREYDYTKKDENVKNLVGYMLDRTLKMFDYDGLPDTIPQYNLEQLLQGKGFCFFTKVHDEFYALWGGLGGEPDVYYQPSKIIIANPALLKKYPGMKQEYDIQEDGVLIRNDTLCLGLLPMLGRYCTMLNENDITMIMNDIVRRVPVALSAADNPTIKSAERFLDKLKKGDFSVIADDAFFASLKSTSLNNATQGSNFQDLVAYSQYIKGSMFNELGLNANYNMKHEQLTANEVNMNSDNLYPFVDDMLYQRQIAVEKINEMFGLEISVDFSSSWDYRILDGEEIEKVDIDNALNNIPNNEDTGVTIDESEPTQETIPDEKEVIIEDGDDEPEEVTEEEKEELKSKVIAENTSGDTPSEIEEEISEKEDDDSLQNNDKLDIENIEKENDVEKEDKSE